MTTSTELQRVWTGVTDRLRSTLPGTAYEFAFQRARPSSSPTRRW